MRKFSSVTSSFRQLKNDAKDQLQALPETIQFEKFKKNLRTASLVNTSPDVKNVSLTKLEIDNLVSSSLTTFALHVESRKAAYLGKGFYTIGPCGEENMSCLGLLAKTTDAMSLHYRHLATSISRQLKGGLPLESIILDRARGYTLSTSDSVTGARHCALGGSPYDYYCTSTLASQAPTAVARALGFSAAKLTANSLKEEDRHLLKDLSKFSDDSVSIVSFGDGSMNNNMLLSALNFSDYATNRGYKCLVLFVVSNNGICISLRNYDFLEVSLQKEAVTKQIFRCNGMNILDVYTSTKEALDFVRSGKKPGILVIDNLPRRFGHAATDRQTAYFSELEILEHQNMNPIENTVELLGLDKSEVLSKLIAIEEQVEEAFEKAMLESKLTSRSECSSNLSAPILGKQECTKALNSGTDDKELNKSSRKQTMRENMTMVYDEIFSSSPQAVYVGEDVRHGGYYLVTNGLFGKYGHRIQDIPPDETMLSALGMGYAQCNLFPIVEIPYAKYLDCGMDMFSESVLTYWCTNGRQKNGILYRLQGFDRGVFGGNFHTHNMLPLLPGLDVVCYSNGEDYVKGIRYCFLQTQQGRVVMSVDSTELLNKRSKQWMQSFPSVSGETNDLLAFDDVIVYQYNSNSRMYDKLQTEYGVHLPNHAVFVVSYGNGVHRAFEAIEEVDCQESVAIVDVPYLSAVPLGLKRLLEMNPKTKVVFADVCKNISPPLAAKLVDLKTTGLLKDRQWEFVAAQGSYNPLGVTHTFLSKNDIKEHL